MSPTPKTKKKIDLSEEARPALRMPLRAADFEIRDSAGALVCSFDYSQQDAEIAAFFVELVNAALTAAAPVERHLCADANCEDYALAGGSFCAAHEAELKAECGVTPTVTIAPETTTELSQLITTEFESATLAAQWDAASILRREG